jgi:hypothetical protein
VSPKRSEPESAALYGLPLGEFTKARNELAGKVRAEGDRERADEIAALPKPSLVAWALNMLPRLRGDELGQLLQAGEGAEGAQARALGGSGDAEQLREAVGGLRRSARQLASEAGEILVKDGHAAREETLLRVASALEAAAVTAAGREALAGGTFAEEPQSAGFELFAGLSTGGAARAPKSGRKAASKPSASARGRERSDARQQARRAVDEARMELEQRRRARVEAESAARADERAAQAREREAADARTLARRSEERAALAREAELAAKERLAEARAQAGS